MAHSNRFTIRNDFSGTLLLAVEPEGAIVSLAAGDEIQVSVVMGVEKGAS